MGVFSAPPHTLVRAWQVAARLGLAARGIFYLVLAALALGLLVGHPPSGREANANGALAAVASTGVGRLLLAGAGIGFLAFAVARVVGACTDRRPGRLRRASTAGQGLVYLALAASTASFLAGHRSTGSEQQQQRMTGVVLALPGGRLLLVTAGLVMLGVCCWQLIVAARDHFSDTLHVERMSRPARKIMILTGRVGIPARALALAPVGVFLVVAGVTADRHRAVGLDAFLLRLMPTAWGRIAVALIVIGFVVFAAYSFFDARFRDVSSGA